MISRSHVRGEGHPGPHVWEGGNTLPCDLSIDIFDVTYPTPNPHEQTDTRENITLSRLQMRRVTICDCSSCDIATAINIYDQHHKRGHFREESMVFVSKKILYLTRELSVILRFISINEYGQPEGMIMRYDE